MYTAIFHRLDSFQFSVLWSSCYIANLVSRAYSSKNYAYILLQHFYGKDSKIHWGFLFTITLTKNIICGNILTCLMSCNKWTLAAGNGVSCISVPRGCRLSLSSLTHLGRDKMAVISQKTFWKWLSWIKKLWISIKISLTFLPRGPINHLPTLVQMAWHWPGDNPLSEPILFSKDYKSVVI